MKTFQFNFRKVGGDIDIYAINGYTQALNAMYKHIAQVTEFNPSKRYIDAVPILEMISQANAELMQLMDEAQKELVGGNPVLSENY